MKYKLLVFENKTPMTGLFHTKYRIAVYDEDKNLIGRIAETLKSWFDGEVVVEPYTDSHQMFVNMNLAKVYNKPFDMTIIGPAEGPETVMILKQTDPSMGVIKLKDEKSLKKDTVKLTLKHHRTISLPL